MYVGKVGSEWPSTVRKGLWHRHHHLAGPLGAVYLQQELTSIPIRGVCRRVTWAPTIHHQRNAPQRPPIEEHQFKPSHTPRALSDCATQHDAPPPTYHVHPSLHSPTYLLCNIPYYIPHLCLLCLLTYSNTSYLPLRPPPCQPTPNQPTRQPTRSPPSRSVLPVWPPARPFIVLPSPSRH